MGVMVVVSAFDFSSIDWNSILDDVIAFAALVLGLISDLFSRFVAWMIGKWSALVDAINRAKPTVEPIIWVVGSLLALFPGSFAIYKWLYFRKSRLPQRFQEMLVIEEKRLKDARSNLLKQIERPESIKPFKAPIFVEPALAKALRAMNWVSWRNRWWFGWGNGRALEAADKNLKVSLDEIDTRMQDWERQRSKHLGQRATALLLRGAIAAAEAEKMRVAGRDGNTRSRDALGYFLQALEIDPADVEAIEYAAHQHRMLDDVDGAIELYERLVSSANKNDPENALIRTRARRYLGEMYERKSNGSPTDRSKRTNLDEAKKILELALTEMPQLARGELLEAFIHRWLGTVENKRETRTLWQPKFDAAEMIFSELIRRQKDVQEAEAGLEEVRRLRAEASARRYAEPPPEEPSVQ